MAVQVLVFDLLQPLLITGPSELVKTGVLQLAEAFAEPNPNSTGIVGLQPLLGLSPVMFIVNMLSVQETVVEAVLVFPHPSLAVHFLC